MRKTASILMIHSVKIGIALFLLVGVCRRAVADAPTRINEQKHRLVILADMGNEPDEEQQMLHMLMYCNEFDLEGLIAVTGKYLRPESKKEYKRVVHPELFLELIDGYEKVLPNLQKHAGGWPEPAALRGMVAKGQPGYGIGDIGEGKASAGSELITRVVLKEDSRPVYIVVNAGANTLAQALRDYRASHSPNEVKTFVKKLIVYENGSQDDAGAWIAHEFPDIHWIRSNFQTYGFMGDKRSIGPHVWKPYPFSNQGQHQWAKQNIQTGHGALGELYPDRFNGNGFLEGGGTTPWLGLITRGLYDPRHPHWGGWSGRYTKEKQKNVLSRHKDIAPTDKTHTPFFVFADEPDSWTYEGKIFNDEYTGVHRWRKDILEDFKARMDWCVQPFEKANHNPIASVNGSAQRCIVRISTRPGESLVFDASASFDPDKGQSVGFSWWIYPEAGSYAGSVELNGADSGKCVLQVPEDAVGSQLHLILDVFDDSPVAVMHDYRRFVIDVEQEVADWWMTPHRMLQTNLREIDASMDIDQYVREVREFGANVVLFNVGGIVANYPTELDFQWRNTFMEGDLVGEVLPKLHAAGVRMIGRFDFSKVNEKIAAQHPDWLYVNEKGGHVNYNGQMHVCLMGEYQQKHALEILKEAVTRYPLDGVFFNMIGFPQKDYSRNFHGICQCANCKASFKAFCGLELPKHDGDPGVLRKHREWQRVQIDRQFKQVRKLVKSVREDIAICTYTVNYVDVMRKESGAPVGREAWHDLDRAQWALLSTGNKQLSNAAVHFYQMIFRHSGAAPWLQTRRLWQQVVNGAWLDFYCIGPLQRLDDRAAIGPSAEIYRFHRDNEQWMLYTESAAEVGLVRHEGEDYLGWMQLLSEQHVPFNLVSFNHSDLAHYKAVIVPESGKVAPAEARKLDGYVQEGGRLLLSGKMPDGLACLGKPVLKKTWPLRHSMYLRIRPEDKDRLARSGLQDFDLVHLRGDFYEYAPAADDTLLRLIHDVMYGPPEKCYYHGVSDIPGLLLKGYGDGRAALLPFELGAMYREWGSQGHAMLAAGTLDNLLETGRRLKVETSELVEVTHRRDPEGRFEWVALYNHSGRMGNSFHQPIPVRDVKIRLDTNRKVRRIVSLTNGHVLNPVEQSEDCLSVVLPRLGTFEIVLVEY